LFLLPVCAAMLAIEPDTFSSPVMLWGVMMVLLFLGGVTVAPYWPSMQVYGVTNLPKLDSTMLYIVFSAMGIPGCGFFTWLIGILGDSWGLRWAFVTIPASALMYAIIVFLEGWVFRQKTEVSK
jgi:fucose permease